MRWIRIVAATVGLAVGAWSADASAFCRSTTCRKDCPTDIDGCPETGLQLWWATSCIGYALNKDLTQNLPPEPVRKALQASFFAWADLDCGGGKRASITFTQLADAECKRSEYRTDAANVNVVLFKDDDWNYRGIDGTLAKTTVTFSAETGEILDADIEVNAAYNNLSVGDAKVEYDLQSIMTHEVGHLLGLAHTSDYTATMYAAYEPGTTDLRVLKPDDLHAVCAVYPPGRKAACDPAPRGGLSLACPLPDAAKTGCSLATTASDSGCYAPFSLLVLVALGRRARRFGR